MLDLELATRSPVSQPPTALARKELLSVRAAQPALSGRVLSVDAQGSDTPVMVMAIIAIVMTLATGLTASFLSASTKGQTEKLTAEVTALKQQLRTGPVAEKLRRQETVAKQVTALTGFLADATPWPSVLDSLAALVPPSTKLTTINIDAEKTVRLEGEAGSEQEVSVFMAALDASTDFSTPRLDSLSLNESVDGSIVLFSIASRYMPQKVTSAQSQNQQLGGSSSVAPDAGLGESNEGAPTGDAAASAPSSAGPDSGSPTP